MVEIIVLTTLVTVPLGYLWGSVYEKGILQLYSKTNSVVKIADKFYYILEESEYIRLKGLDIDN